MNTDKMINLLKMESLSIPMYLLNNYTKLDIDANAMLVLAYLLQDNTFDCKTIGNSLSISEKDVLGNINQLQEKGLLAISVAKDKKGMVDEVLSLEPFYNKIALLLMDSKLDSKAKENKANNIYEIFEKELGRTLSPIEYEIISGWLESKYTEDLILEALREAVYNGVSNLRYIDKILFEWHKKGFKRVEDIRKDREHFRKAKDTKIELPDYNWLEEHE